MISKTFFKTLQGQIARVTFTLPDSLWADTICLVGDFDGWNPAAHPLEHRRDGSWALTLDLPVGRTYEFYYLRDGQWMSDSQADGYVHAPDGITSFLVVTDPHHDGQLHSSEMASEHLTPTDHSPTVR
ncbi:MAG TPA: isoamylase early set domain-containing protein [Ktedonobacterales bacterium]